MICIFTHRLGFESDYIIDRLKERKIPFFRFNTNFEIEGTKINADFRNNTVTFECDGRKIITEQISIAWFQQTPPEPYNAKLNSPEARRFETFRQLYFWACCQIKTPWLNHPFKILNATNKTTQYKIAREIGLGFPETIITNNAEKICDFFSQYDGKVIIKNLATPWYITDEGKTKAAYTKFLTSEMLSEKKNIEYAPLIYQRYIPRKADIRAVVIGTEIFSGITYAINEETKYDIRRMPLKIAKYEPFVLPLELHGKILQLMKCLELQYASIDIALNTNDNFYFLDLNATGAFFWLEALTGLPITDSITDFLVRFVKRSHRILYLPEKKKAKRWSKKL